MCLNQRICCNLIEPKTQSAGYPFSFIIPGMNNSPWIVTRTVDVGDGETKPVEGRGWSSRDTAVALKESGRAALFCAPIRQEYNASLNIPQYLS